MLQSLSHIFQENKFVIEHHLCPMANTMDTQSQRGSRPCDSKATTTVSDVCRALQPPCCDMGTAVMAPGDSHRNCQ